MGSRYAEVGNDSIDVACFVEGCRRADRVEVRFNGSNGDKKRFGATVSRQRPVVCPVNTDWEWKEVSVGNQRVASPLDGCRGFEVMPNLMLTHQ